MSDRTPRTIHVVVALLPNGVPCANLKTFQSLADANTYARAVLGFYDGVRVETVERAR